MISDDKIAEIRQAARISEFVTPHVALKRRGRSLLGLCPFHNEKTPSFSVDDERGFYHCFGCSAGGNVFKFLMEIERLTFPEAVRKVAERYGITVPEVAGTLERRDPGSYEINASAASYYRRFLVETEHGSRFRDYLAGRGVGEEAAERFVIGAASPSGTGLAKWLAKEGVDLRKAVALGLLVERGGTAYDRFRDRLMFPIRDAQGRVIGFGGRQVEAGDGPKYLNSPESEVYQKSRALYGIYEARDALRHASSVLLVEGYLDVIALSEAGIQNVVATCGTALTVEQARMVRRYVADVVTLFDGDEAGKRAAARAFPIFIEAGIWAKGLTLPDGDDPDTFVRKAGADAMLERVKSAVPLTEAFLEHTVSASGKDPASIGRVCAELANVLAKVTDPFEHDALVRKAAHSAGISDEVLRREARRGAAKSRGREPEAEPKRAATNLGTQRGGAAGPDESLVSLLLADGTLVAVIGARNVVDLMEESVWRELARDMIASARDGRSIDPAEALDRLPDQLRARVAARLLDDSLGNRERRERMMEDCIRSMERAARRRHNAGVLGDLRKTEQLRAGEIPHETLTDWRPRNSSDV